MIQCVGVLQAQAPHREQNSAIMQGYCGSASEDCGQARLGMLLTSAFCPPGARDCRSACDELSSPAGGFIESDDLNLESARRCIHTILLVGFSFAASNNVYMHFLVTCMAGPLDKCGIKLKASATDADQVLVARPGRQ